MRRKFPSNFQTISLHRALKIQRGGSFLIFITAGYPSSLLLDNEIAKAILIKVRPKISPTLSRVEELWRARPDVNCLRLHVIV